MNEELKKMWLNFREYAYYQYKLGRGEYVHELSFENFMNFIAFVYPWIDPKSD